MGAQNANSGIPRGQVVHGARAYLALGGKPVGYCQGVSFGISVEQAPNDVLDDMETTEFIPTAYRVTNVSAQFVELIGRTLISLGIQPTQENLVLGDEMVMEVKDRPSDSAKYVLEGVQFQSASFDIRKGNLTAAQCSFVAKRLRDEHGRV